ncbi:MAG: hypothetical protein V8S99_03345 [Oscillospiraceae bacterium]
MMLTSSPADIVEISNMDVTAKKVGTAVITATVTEGETTRTLGSVTITVELGVTAITPANEPSRSTLTAKTFPCP